MSKPSDYWITFWVAEVLKVGKKEYVCYGVAVENDEISAILVENPDGTREYLDDKDLLKAAQTGLSFKPYKSKRKNK
jgi:hypothetical protein